TQRHARRSYHGPLSFCVGAGGARMTLPVDARRLHDGMGAAGRPTPTLHPPPNNHSCNAHSPVAVVANVRTSCCARPAVVTRTHATTVCLCTSSPAHRAWITSLTSPPFCRRDVPRGVNLPSVLRDRGGPWRQSRVRTGRRVHTRYRASRTTHCSTSVPAPAPYQFPGLRVDPRGRGAPVMARFLCRSPGAFLGFY